jgi:hypothetical protein
LSKLKDWIDRVVISEAMDSDKILMFNDRHIKVKPAALIPIPSKERSCDGKRQYSHKKYARRAMQRLQRRQAESGLVVYKCRYGEHYHVGHKISKGDTMSNLQKRIKKIIEANTDDYGRRDFKAIGQQVVWLMKSKEGN